MAATTKDYVFYGIILVISGVFLYSTSQIEVTNKTTAIGPTGWPYILLITLVVLSIMGLTKTFITATKERVRENTRVNDEEEIEARLFNMPMSIISISAIIIYTLVLYFAGFIISTILFIYILTQFLGAKKQIVIVLFSVLITIAFIWLFSIVLKVPLPRGVGIFRGFSLFFY